LPLIECSEQNRFIEFIASNLMFEFYVFTPTQRDVWTKPPRSLSKPASLHSTTRRTYSHECRQASQFLCVAHRLANHKRLPCVLYAQPNPTSHVHPRATCPNQIANLLRPAPSQYLLPAKHRAMNGQTLDIVIAPTDEPKSDRKQTNLNARERNDRPSTDSYRNRRHKKGI
jgi:hypothetical protein